MLFNNLQKRFLCFARQSINKLTNNIPKDVLSTFAYSIVYKVY